MCAKNRPSCYFRALLGRIVIDEAEYVQTHASFVDHPHDDATSATSTDNNHPALQRCAHQAAVDSAPHQHQRE